MDPYYRFFFFKNPLSMISWNAVLACDTFQQLLDKPAEVETVKNVRSRHISRMLDDGITNSVLDAMPTQIPYYCYLGYALGDNGILPFEGRFSLRWYPIHDVQKFWNRNLGYSKLALEKTASQIHQKFKVVLRGPPEASLP